MFPTKMRLFEKNPKGVSDDLRKYHASSEITSSLLAISPEAGILVAGVPYGLIIDDLASVRQAIKHQADAASASAAEKPKTSLNYFPKQIIRDIRARHIVFFTVAQQERYLLVAADYPSPTIYVHSVDTIFRETADWGFIANLGQFCNAQDGIKICQPHPTYGFLCAIVSGSGKLWLVDLLRSERKTTARHVTENQHERNENGNGDAEKQGMRRTFLDNVSCLTWSDGASIPGATEAALIISGRMNGTATVITQEGDVVAELPRPDNLPNEFHGEQKLAHKMAIALDFESEAKPS